MRIERFACVEGRNSEISLIVRAYRDNQAWYVNGLCDGCLEYREVDLRDPCALRRVYVLNCQIVDCHEGVFMDNPGGDNSPSFFD